MNTIKTVIFIIAVPGSVAFIIPVYLILPLDKNTIQLGSFSWLALPFWIAGLLILFWCAADFVRRGQGTPLPADAPRHLVVDGLYRYVRNPMYVGVLLFVIGNAIWFGSPLLGGYTIFLWIVFHTFVLLYEEQHLRKIFGTEYQQYCLTVPRWIPHFR
jgi:protein-S-isoprenylcysteine O-methyltransferase Ste14